MKFSTKLKIFKNSLTIPFQIFKCDVGKLKKMEMGVHILLLGVSFCEITKTLFVLLGCF